MLLKLLFVILVCKNLPNVVLSQDNDKQDKTTSVNKCPGIDIVTAQLECNTSSSFNCNNDSDCDADRVCCSNGCSLVCMLKMEEPVEIDYVVEPSFDDLTLLPLAVNRGTSSFKSDHQLEVICTTTFQDPPSVALGCDAGYICKPDVTNDEDEPFSSPNKGICVPETAEVSLKTTPTNGTLNPMGLKRRNGTAMLKEKVGEKSVFLPGGCFLTHEEFKDIEDLKHKSYVINCTCISGSVQCHFINETKKGNDEPVSLKTS